MDTKGTHAARGELAPEPAQPSRKPATWLIYFIVFLDLLGVGLIAPLSAYIVAKFSASGQAVSDLTMVYSAAQFLATPVLGVLSDRFGRRPVLLVSLFGSAVGYFIFGFAGSLWMLFAGRILDGFTGGNISTAQAYIADITPPKDRAKAYGLIGVAFGLGFFLGPAISGLILLLAGHGEAAGEVMKGGASVAAAQTPVWNPSLMLPVYFAGGLSLCTTVLAYFLLPETHGPERRVGTPLALNDVNPLAVLWRAMKVAGIPALLGAIFAMNFAHAGFRSTFGVVMRDVLKIGAATNAAIFIFIGFSAIFVQGFLVRKVAPKIGDKRAVLIGLGLGAVAFALMPLATHHVWSVIAIVAIMSLMGLAGPTMTGMLSRAAPRSEEGATMGASQSASSLAMVIGPAVAGWLYDRAGPGWPFWAGAAAIAAAFFIIATWHGRTRPAGEETGLPPGVVPAAPPMAGTVAGEEV